MGDGVDFWDLDLYSVGIPHEVFARLRRDEPVAWNAASEAGTGFWSLTRYDDVARANRDHEAYSSHERGIMMFDTPTLESHDDSRMMIELDPPLHTRYRRLVKTSSRSWCRRRWTAMRSAKPSSTCFFSSSP